MNTANAKSNRIWTLAGLALALLVIPMIAVGFRLGFAPLSAGMTVARELAMFAGAAMLLLLVRYGERLPWSSIGLRRDPLGRTALWVLIGLLACGAATVAGLLSIQAAGLQFGSGGSGAKHSLWVISLVVLRAGIVEELGFRAYAIERLEALTGNRWVAVGLPLVVFAAFHASAGLGGVLLAFLLGSVMSWLYLWKRNLWVIMIVHFVVNFIPNVVLAGLFG